MPMTIMPKSGMPPGALPMLILRVLNSGSLHGYAIAQRIHVLSSEVLAVEEGLLYPTLQKILVKGWVTADWGTSETGRKVRFYRLTPDGRCPSCAAAAPGRWGAGFQGQLASRPFLPDRSRLTILQPR